MIEFSVYPVDVLARRQYRKDAKWLVMNVPIQWFGVVLVPGTAFLSFESILYTVVVLGCPIDGVRVVYKRNGRTGGFLPRPFGKWEIFTPK